MSQPNLDQALKLFNQVENELASMQAKMQEIKLQLSNAQSELTNELDKSSIKLENNQKYLSIKKINQRLLEQLNDLQKKYHAMLDHMSYLHMEFAVYARLVYENWLTVAVEEQKELHHKEELTKLRDEQDALKNTQLEELARKLRLTPYRS